MIRILLAGQGGQGVLSAGRFLAESGLHEGREVSYLPAYGPEMRGGTANCAVIISGEEIASPLCTEPDVLIALNGPSFHKFVPRVKSGGIVIVNGSLSDSYAGRSDVRIFDYPLNDIAIEAGDIRAANMAALGILCAAANVVQERSILNCLNEKFVGKPRAEIKPFRRVRSACFRKKGSAAALSRGAPAFLFFAAEHHSSVSSFCSFFSLPEGFFLKMSTFRVI